MHRIVYVVMMHIFIVSMISAGEHGQRRSAQMPQRSIQKAPGLISSASYDDLRAGLLQKQVASRDIPVSANSDDAFSGAGDSTRQSSFAEPLTDDQQEHETDLTINEIHAEWLVPSGTVTVVKKETNGMHKQEKTYKKDLASDIKILESALKKIRLPSDMRREKNKFITESLLCVLQKKHKTVLEQTLERDISAIRRQQSQCCCVIL